MSHPFKYGANHRIVGKCDPQKLSYAGAWQEATGTFSDLAAHISKGLPWMPALLDGNLTRTQNNSNRAEVIAADFDNGLTIEQAIAHPFIRNHAGLGIESASSKPEHHKFRIVFRLPYPVTGWQTIRICNRYLIHQLGTADPACKDASRYFFGAPGRSPFLLNEDAVLPESFITDALKWDEAQERAAQAEYEAALARRREFTGSDPKDKLELLEMALSVGAPIRSPGCGNYAECVAIAAGIRNEFGDATAIALLNKYIPPHTASGDNWNPEKVVRGLARTTTARPASLGSVFYICQQNGFQFPKSEQEWNDQRREPDPVAYAAFVAWEADQEKIYAAQERESFLGRVVGLIKRKRNKAAKNAAVGFARPEAKEDATVIYGEGERLETWQRLAEKHQYILDQSGTGAGKSHTAGLVEPEMFGAERVWFVDTGHRNPTTKNVEENYADLTSRHPGLTVDERGKLRRITKADQEIAVEANCMRANAVGVLREKNIPGADTDVVCDTCPWLNACRHFSGKGFGFRHERKQALVHNRIRCHPDSIPDPSEFDFAGDFAFWDEPGDSFTTSHKVFVKLEDLDKLTVALADSGLYPIFKPALDVLRQLLEQPGGRWGVTHQTIAETLLSVLPEKESIDYDAIAEATAPDLSVLTPPDEVDRDSFFEEMNQRLDARKAEYEKDKVELKRQKELDLAEAYLTQTGEKVSKAIGGKAIAATRALLNIEYKAKQKSLRRKYEEECKAIKAEYREEFKEVNRAVVRSTAQHSAQATEILKTTVLKQWFADFLSAIYEGDRVLHIRWGEMAIAIPETRHRTIASNMKNVVFLDATLSVEDLALKLGCEVSDIAVCKQATEDHGNLEIIQVADMGRMGMQRGKEQQRQAAAIVAHYKALDPTTQVIDFKRFSDGADGAWWRDSRGVNDFTGTNTLVLVGTPCRNLNDLLAEYALLTGCHNSEDEGFKGFVDRKILADIHQANGRLRANRRPDEKLTIVLLANFNLDIPVRHVRAVDITPEAGGKFDRFVLAVETAIATLTEQGVKLTQSAISQIAGYSQQYISKHWKLLQTLLEGSNSKSSKDSEPPPEAELIEAMATESHPLLLIEQLESGWYEWLKPSQWLEIWPHLSGEAQVNILNALAFTLSDSVWEVAA